MVHSDPFSPGPLPSMEREPFPNVTTESHHRGKVVFETDNLRLMERKNWALVRRCGSAEVVVRTITIKAQVTGKYRCMRLEAPHVHRHAATMTLDARLTLNILTLLLTRPD